MRFRKRSARNRTDLYRFQQKCPKAVSKGKFVERANIRAGRPPKEQLEALGDHVIAVADSLFIEKGYGGTSMATVALRARIGKQTLYRRYPDKAALFRAVIRRRIDAMIVDPSDNAALRDPLAELKALGAAALSAALDPDFIQLYRIIIAEAGAFPELANSVADNFGSGFLDRCRAAIARAQAAGRCGAGDPAALAECFLWSLLGQAFHKALAGQHILTGAAERRAQLDLAWRLFMHGIAIDQG
jgi:AcrR family transcriptional regulator